MENSKFKSSLALYLSIGFSLYTVAMKLFADTDLDNGHYWGLGLMALSTILFYTKKPWYEFVFGISLILGAINLISIFPFFFYFSLGETNLNPLFLILLLLFLSFNQHLLNRINSSKKGIKS